MGDREEIKPSDGEGERNQIGIPTSLRYIYFEIN